MKMINRMIKKIQIKQSKWKQKSYRVDRNYVIKSESFTALLLIKNQGEVVILWVQKVLKIQEKEIKMYNHPENSLKGTIRRKNQRWIYKLTVNRANIKAQKIKVWVWISIDMMDKAQ